MVTKRTEATSAWLVKLRKAGYWVLAPVGLIVCALSAVAALALTAWVTEDRTLAVIVGAAGIFGGWPILRSAARGISQRPGLRFWLPIGGSALVLIVLAATIGSLLFGPTPAYNPPVVSPATQYWDLSTGSRIAYIHLQAHGEVRPAPVIFVHGGPGSPGTGQEDLQRRLAQSGFDVYQYDQIGAGLSERLSDVSEYTIERHVHDLEAIREIIGAEQVVLVGNSWGGQLVANYIAAFPERVIQAVVSSPGTIWAPAFTNESRLTPAGNQDVEDAVSAQPRFMFAQVLLQTIGPNAANALLPDSKMDGVFQEFVSSLDMAPGCPEVRSANAEEPLQGVGFWVNAVTTRDANDVADPRAALQNVETDMLVLRGECDYIAWEVTREYWDVFPNSTLLVIEDAGHTIHVHQAETYAEAVLSFLLGEPLPVQPYTEALAQSPKALSGRCARCESDLDAQRQQRIHGPG